MSRRRLKEGDLIILDNMPSGWSRAGESYAGMLYERFDPHKYDAYSPTWCWKVQWFSDIPLSYHPTWGITEITILNLTSIEKGTHIPLKLDTYS